MEEKKSYYAIIPANVRYDADLTPNAKLLYGEITALCNEKGYCWASNDYFSKLYGVSKSSITKWVSALVNKGYIFSEMQYKEGSKEVINRYLKLSNNPIVKNYDRYSKKVGDPIVKIADTPIVKNDEDNITSINNTINNTYQSINHKETEKAPATLEDYDRYDRVIKDNIGYDVLLNEIEQSQLDEIVSIMIEVCCSNAKTIRVGKENKHSEVVRSQFLKLNSFHIRYVINRMQETPTKIKNVKSYIVTCLYNAPITMENYYTALVNADMHEMNEIN